VVVAPDYCPSHRHVPACPFDVPPNNYVRDIELVDGDTVLRIR
jgi:hypothetical protein